MAKEGSNRKRDKNSEISERSGKRSDIHKSADTADNGVPSDPKKAGEAAEERYAELEFVKTPEVRQWNADSTPRLDVARRVVRSGQVGDDHPASQGQDRADDEGQAQAEAVVNGWAAWINESYNQAKANLIETGRRLVDASERLTDKRLNAVYERLGFGERQAQKLKGYYNAFLEIPPENLPNNYRALDALQNLENRQVEQAIANGDVHRKLTAKDASAVVQRYRGEEAGDRGSSKAANYKLGRLRAVATAFQDLGDEEIQEMVERLREDERAHIKATMERLVRYLQTSQEEHDG